MRTTLGTSQAQAHTLTIFTTAPLPVCRTIKHISRLKKYILSQNSQIPALQGGNVSIYNTFVRNRVDYLLFDADYSVSFSNTSASDKSRLNTSNRMASNCAVGTPITPAQI